MNGVRYAALILAVLVSTTGCLGLFSGDEEAEQTQSTSIDANLGNETRREIEERTSAQFRNYTVPGQEVLDDVVKWFNGTVGSGQGVAAYEDRNDRSGLAYNKEVIMQDLSGDIPAGQPAVIRAKLWYFAGPGASADLDLVANVPGTQTDLAGDDCDEFSWKICVQEMSLSTVGVSGAPMQIGVEVANGRSMQGMDYFLRVEVDYFNDVITPDVPYAVTVPENATGLVVTSAKGDTGEHIQAEFLVIGPDDQLIEHSTYNDISIPTESKLIPVPGPGEYVVYALELHGGFLGVEADVPVPKDVREIRPLARVEESVADASAPAPGTGGYCDPTGTAGCAPYNEGGSTTFSVEGTFPLEVIGWIGEEGGQQANLNAEVRISSGKGLVYKLDKFVQYEDERGTLGLTRDEFHANHTWENLDKGEYTVSYVIDGTGTVGHTVVTYKR